MNILGIIAFCLLALFGVASYWYKRKDALEMYRRPQEKTDDRLAPESKTLDS